MRRKGWLFVLGICLADVIACSLAFSDSIFLLPSLLVGLSQTVAIIFVAVLLANSSRKKYELQKQIGSSGSMSYVASPREANRTSREIVRDVFGATSRVQGGSVLGARAADIAKSVGSRRRRRDEDYQEN